MKPLFTMKSDARERVMKAFRARGHRASNLWLVYSPKTDRDWILNSDLQYIYWLYFLEADPKVIGFEMGEQYSTDADFIVSYSNETVEFHYVRSVFTSEIPEALTSDGTVISCQSFNGETLRRKSVEALRWAKPIAFAAAMRDQRCEHLMNALILIFKKLKSGTIIEICQCLEEYERPDVVGAVMRHYSNGNLDISLAVQPFDLNTVWRYEDEQG